jgi:hypothetical protein
VSRRYQKWIWVPQGTKFDFWTPPKFDIFILVFETARSIRFMYRRGRKERRITINVSMIVPIPEFNLIGLGGIVPAHGIRGNQRYSNICLVPIFQLVEQVINAKT